MIESLTFHDIVSDFVRSRYATVRNGVKLLARHANVSPRTAENWLDGYNAPASESLLNLMAACPELEAAITQSIATRRAALHRRADAAVNDIKTTRGNRHDVRPARHRLIRAKGS